MTDFPPKSVSKKNNNLSVPAFEVFHYCDVISGLACVCSIMFHIGSLFWLEIVFFQEERF